MHAVISKQKIMVMSLTDFLDVASRRHNDVILTSFSVYLSIQSTSSTRYERKIMRFSARATVELLRQETADLLRRTYGLQTAQISVVWITRSALSCSIVSTIDKSN